MEFSWLKRVLVVEDSLAERFRMTALLKNLGYEVLEAGDGTEALAILQETQVATVLSDWSMPQMSGLELCQRVMSADFNNPYFILVTGRDTTEDLVEGMESGADDFIRKPFNREELRVRLIAGQRIMQMRSSLEAQNHQLESSIERERQLVKQIRQDLHSAAEMLTDLLPDPMTCENHLQIGGSFKPAIDIGGDFYSFFRLDEDHMGFYLFDIAGHGVPAALLAFSLARSLSPTAEQDDLLYDNGKVRSPADVVTRLNEQLTAQKAKTQYLTMVYGVLNFRTGEGQFCQAGHPHPLLLGSEQSFQLLGQSGFPVNIIDDADYENVSFYLRPGETLVLYSDGITEAENPSAEQFGNDRFAAALGQAYGKRIEDMLSSVGDALQGWTDGAAQADDMTLLLIRKSLDG